MNLADEFQKLMASLYQQIENKRAAGELSDKEAKLLTDHVADRTGTTDGGWNTSTYECSVAASYDEEIDYDFLNDAWSPSSTVC